ncbi:MAG TPA: phosphatase PAP2 family protein [Kofleriaceae bacterium]|jgi:membrane-associated phospholipid phosphatase|nr:phosphatase PAP2 family protein [Kofleriaceae bacterium]
MATPPSSVQRGFVVVAGVAREWLMPSRTMIRSARWPLIGFAYIGVIALLGGLRPDHVMIGCLGCLDLYNEKSRAFLRTFLPFIATGVIFDSMRYFYWAGIEGRVHVVGPYELDRAWFGIGGKTLNEIFLEHHWAIADLFAGFAYLTFVAEFLAFAMLLFFRGYAEHARTFAWCFLVVNVLGFMTYFVYPAAPPWYVTAHGFGPAVAGVLPSAAAAHRFDVLLGTHFFDGMYGHGIDVFGAIPSLHVAYPLMAAILSFRFAPLRKLRALAVAFVPLMCFSAIYLQHHYVIDVVLGLSYAVITVTLVTWAQRRCAR